MTTTKSEPMKQELISRAAVEKALIEAGYKKVTFSPLVVKLHKPGGKAGEVEDVPVVDVIIEGAKIADRDVPAIALLDPKTANFMALSVARDLGFAYRELQTFGSDVILRWAKLGE
jgi:hypothetical protein